jgi:plasmid stabilization system protein ParE
MVEALDWYAKHDEDVATDFLSRVDQALDGLASNPNRWPEERRFGFRRVRLASFPYSIYYEIGHLEVLVLAVAHHKRRPGYWIERSSG